MTLIRQGSEEELVAAIPRQSLSTPTPEETAESEAFARAWRQVVAAGDTEAFKRLAAMTDAAPRLMSWLACEGDAAGLEAMLTAGADPNAQFGLSLIETAVSFGRAEAVELLLRAGAIPKPTRGSRPLHHHAVLQGHTGIARLLVDRDGLSWSDLNSFNGATLWHCFAHHPDPELAPLLVNAKIDVNAADLGKKQPLHVAIGIKNELAALALLELGADPNARDGQDVPPLAAAVVRDWKRLLKRSSRAVRRFLGPSAAEIHAS